jgi:hypothetical protein
MAHSLEIHARPQEGTGERDGDAVRGTLRFSSTDLHVEGVLHGSTLDRKTLSASDVTTIDERMAHGLFGGAATFDIVIEGHGSSATIEVKTPRARATCTARVSFAEDAAGLKVHGEARLSLKALGAEPVAGPLGAFRVSDALEVAFDGTFAAES